MHRMRRLECLECHCCTRVQDKTYAMLIIRVCVECRKPDMCTGRYRFANSSFVNSHFAKPRFANSHFADQTKMVKFHSHFANFPMLFLVLLSVSVDQAVIQFLALSYSLISRPPFCSPNYSRHCYVPRSVVCQNGRLAAYVMPV